MAKSLAKLIMVEGHTPGREFEITKEVFTIGRAEDNDIVLSNKIVSRHHARIQIVNNEFKLFDTSLNGTRVNRREVREKVLVDNDEIALGDAVFKFCIQIQPEISLLSDDSTVIIKKNQGL